ncbi:hypothetical protein A2U01_0066277 [Trifolium medium]|uniref:Retrovirus-related Pol polyprotein from transposon TNT 1-94 n=1 Tax=Trifolium medium TaxID=97028 RepID=A0A392S868_9FABA|nr:hypothetical protein [Trifolium medium]
MLLKHQREYWDIIENGHVGDAKLKQVRLRTLKRQFELLQTDPTEKVAEYFNRITQVSNAMESCGEIVTVKVHKET